MLPQKWTNHPLVSSSPVLGSDATWLQEHIIGSILNIPGIWWYKTMSTSEDSRSRYLQYLVELKHVFLFRLHYTACSIWKVITLLTKLLPEGWFISTSLSNFSSLYLKSNMVRTAALHRIRKGYLAFKCLNYKPHRSSFCKMRNSKGRYKPTLGSDIKVEFRMLWGKCHSIRNPYELGLRSEHATACSILATEGA